ncbi:hypothetical protein AFV8_gp21 [Betalipothrixvirus puteoliense]|uniref:Uncharacterized protein n=1 Tax=Betalipothrixvirus puteoliense TaxID=346884 RepID=A7WKV1_9VIRU|nr:hypothetical protein AFV8_gp21 [Acidianus filamentous virus 8]CAJ31698.1 conserved hypothetical protein [Acidianus filamentous virus 8]
MQMQILLTKEKTPKLSKNIDFATTSAYDVNDLRDKIKPGDKFIIRQGDLIVANYSIDYPRRRGLRYAHPATVDVNGRLIDVFRNSHYILHTEDFISIYHSEHGVVIIPLRGNRINYYTIDGAID